MQKHVFNDFQLKHEDSLTVKSFFSKKNDKKMWKFIDSLKICDFKDNEVEVIFQKDSTLLRVWSI